MTERFVGFLEQNIGKTLFDKSVQGRRATDIATSDIPDIDPLPQERIRTDLVLPEVGQLQLLSHYLQLANINFCIESGEYFLASCTMEYNPAANELIAKILSFVESHPAMPEELVQGNLQIMYETQNYLSEITGMKATSLAPMAGSQGELSGVLMFKKYHESQNDHLRRKILVPDSAHGTNFATTTMAGYEVDRIQTAANGDLDLEDLRTKLDRNVAGFMITLPSTFGIFDRNIETITKMVHEQGALVYCDGANMNALLGKVKPSQLGIDMIHLNLHKTFSTPHGGGGPGSGAICVQEHLQDFLPKPIVIKEEDRYHLAEPNRSIGALGNWHGNFGIHLRAHAYIRALGAAGLRQASEDAVIIANYIRANLEEDFEMPYPRNGMHEFVVLVDDPVSFAKRLMDYGIHPPMVGFPTPHALMTEPTQSVTKEGTDYFIQSFKAVGRESRDNPELLETAPHITIIGRLGQSSRLDVRWKPAENA